MGTYSELLKSRGVARIIAAQLTARFPAGMLSLAFLLHVEQQTGSPPFNGAHLRPQSKRDTGAVKPS